MNTIDYLQSYKNYFWVWEENGEVITIPGGSTVAFKEQIIEILTLLAEQGLPSFGSILLTLIATNDTIDNSLDLVHNIIENEIISKAESNNSIKIDFGKSFELLQTLRNIPKEYKIGKRRKILLQTIFSNSHNRIKIDNSKGLAKNIKTESYDKIKTQTLQELSAKKLTQELRVLDLLARQFPSVKSIIEAIGNLPEMMIQKISKVDI
jgi:MoxR-vWA-beta-propeller ternary system domain bpX0